MIKLNRTSGDFIQVFGNKKVLRHEIVYAFFYESGLAENSFDVSKWAKNEEMVDWYAIQDQKYTKHD